MAKQPFGRITLSRTTDTIVDILCRTINSVTHWNDAGRALAPILVAVKAGQSGTVARPTRATVAVQRLAVAGGARFERGDHHGVVFPSTIMCFD